MQTCFMMGEASLLGAGRKTLDVERTAHLDIAMVASQTAGAFHKYRKHWRPKTIILNFRGKIACIFLCIVYFIILLYITIILLLIIKNIA